MAENLELLIAIQEQVIQCRRLAAQIFDPETSRRLYEFADEIERRAREVDSMSFAEFFNEAIPHDGENGACSRPTAAKDCPSGTGRRQRK
jgi:hypothetical protein